MGIFFIAFLCCLYILYFSLFCFILMEIVSVIIAFVLGFLGLLWAIVPWIPWPLLWYAWLIVIQIFLDNPFTVEFLVIWWAVSLFVMFLDYALPLVWTKKFWWSKWWNTGCIVWTILWIFFGPVGVIVLPFLWALIGEYLYKSDLSLSLKAAFGSFLGFLWGVLIKIVISVLMILQIISVCIQHRFF